MSLEKIKKLRKVLLDQLLQIASASKCSNRLCKLEETHKRINALDRYVSETSEAAPA